ncbi:DUF7344 domain-containing protein [Halobellus captivus]|uniref:DUF7344 domain-containing protein n=1 Tax=Halobellus captivus TaxID=2592614 RepID=UPI0011A389CC|nr:hypothetical protein [Halobellus captivus]
MNSLDEVFRLLSKERRRYALYYLYQQDRPVTIEELTDAVNEWEAASAEGSEPDERFEDVMLTLNHTHLPEIESAASVEFDRENEGVRITDAAREVEILLSIAQRLEKPSLDIDTIDVSELLN